jgi:hypothetical protein
MGSTRRSGYERPSWAAVCLARSRRLKQKGIRARSDAFHPDVVAESESKANHQRSTGSDLIDARTNIGDAMITPAPRREKTQHEMGSVFLAGTKKGKKSTSVYPGD